ncbi:hypothetical protein [Nocardia rhizosphaerae]|uniref:C2H2-type domain-containing protein n=1 Tax=Nocardia rhizosphaerae TaxID=1691571 RepID=A0ABV8LDB1_9NOCA
MELTMTCTDCGALLGESTPERLATHRQWKHPTPAERAEVWPAIAGTAARIEFAVLDSDLLNAQNLLHELHQLVLRAKTYVDDELTEEVSL